MSNNNATVVTAAPTFLTRVAAHDATRKGLAGAAAGLLVAVVSEVLWPSA